MIDPASNSPELINYKISPFISNERKSLVEAIKTSMLESKAENRYVNTSISGQAVVVRYIQMPRMTAEELKKALTLGVGKYIPFSLEDVNYDFQILDEHNRAEKTMKVLLVAAKKKIVEERLSILRDANLIPYIIDVDSFSIVNSFQLMSQSTKGIIGILDIGADITSTTILRNDIPSFNRDIPLGGKHINEKIMEDFEISAREAEDLKRDPQRKYGELLNAIRPVLDSLARELHLSFNYCESQLGGSVQKLYLTGGTAKFKGIDKVLNSILGVDVEVWDPTQKLAVGQDVNRQLLAEAGPLLTVAIGLALRK